MIRDAAGGCFVQYKTPMRLFLLPISGAASRRMGLLVALLLCGLASVIAQQSLPESPSAKASISGVVTDSDGAAVADASVVLTYPERPSVAGQKTVSAADGGFAFSDVAAGSFEINIAADGFAAQTIAGTVAAGQQDELTAIALRASVNIGVNVSSNTVEMAEIEVRQEEKQRVAGIIPNFYIVYGGSAPPLDAKQKYRLAWRTSVDPTSFLAAGIVAGIEQGANTFPAYGQGAEGYAKRFGAAYADGFSATLLSNAVFPALFKQDPRYFYKGTGSVRSRVGYALATAVVCKGDNGRWQPCYSGILGSLAAGGISNLYYPAADRNGVGLTFVNTSLGIAGAAVSNLFEEFLLKKFTTHSHGQTHP